MTENELASALAAVDALGAQQRGAQVAGAKTSADFARDAAEAMAEYDSDFDGTLDCLELVNLLNGIVLRKIVALCSQRPITLVLTREGGKDELPLRPSAVAAAATADAADVNTVKTEERTLSAAEGLPLLPPRPTGAARSGWAFVNVTGADVTVKTLPAGKVVSGRIAADEVIGVVEKRVLLETGKKVTWLRLGDDSGWVSDCACVSSSENGIVRLQFLPTKFPASLGSDAHVTSAAADGGAASGPESSSLAALRTKKNVLPPPYPPPKPPPGSPPKRPSRAASTAALHIEDVAAEVARERGARREDKLRSLKRAMRLFKQSDYDLNGGVDFEELCAIMPVCLRARGRAADAGGEVPQAEDGGAGSDAAAEWLAANVSTGALLAYFDADGDGQLGMKEFITLYKTVRFVYRLAHRLSCLPSSLPSCHLACASASSGIVHIVLTAQPLPLPFHPPLPRTHALALGLRCGASSGATKR